MNYLLDTNICIYFLKGLYGLEKKITQVGFDNLYISEITVAELKYGAQKSNNSNASLKVVNRLAEKFKQLPITAGIDIYAIEKARLRQEGRIVDDLDLFIGATALAHQMIMVTNNEKHLGRLSGIEIENWTLLYDSGLDLKA